jgi:hypothetical protein
MFLVGNLKLGQGSEEVASIALLIGVTDELSVELLVTGEGDAAGLLVFIVEELLVGGIQLSNGLVGHPLDAVGSVFIDSNSAVTVNINGSEARVNEKSECCGEFGIRFALAGNLDTLLEFINRHLTVLVEVGKIGDLVPEVLHDLLVLLEGGIVEVAFSFDDCVPDSQTFEVVLVQETVVVNVVHVPDDELDAVVP